MLNMKYFVLKPRSNHAKDRYAEASRKAMEAYANHIRIEDEQLSGQLIIWAQAETERERIFTVGEKGSRVNND